MKVLFILALIALLFSVDAQSTGTRTAATTGSSSGVRTVSFTDATSRTASTRTASTQSGSTRSGSATSSSATRSSATNNNNGQVVSCLFGTNNCPSNRRQCVFGFCVDGASCACSAGQRCLSTSTNEPQFSQNAFTQTFTCPSTASCRSDSAYDGTSCFGVTGSSGSQGAASNAATSNAAATR